jgi:hypothetical protein
MKASIAIVKHIYGKYTVRLHMKMIFVKDKNVSLRSAGKFSLSHEVKENTIAAMVRDKTEQTNILSDSCSYILLSV